MPWGEDDIKTMYMAPDDAVASNDGTVVFGMDYVAQDVPATATHLRVQLFRERTGERIDVPLPAVIGRGTIATTRLGGNLAISRRHVELCEENGRLVITDLGSVNGTRVQGQRLAAGQRVVVSNGMQINLGSEPFRLYVSE